MNNLIIRFSTLTPIWTGGAKRNGDIIHETGLIGSLRWWYEGIIRGMGGEACDPTTKEKCRFKPDEYQKALKRNESGASLLSSAGLCPVCQLFGATGWQRQFRLVANGLTPQPLIFQASPKVYTAAGNWLWRMFGGDELGGRKEGRGSKVTFSFGVQTLWGKDASLKIIPLNHDGGDVCARFSFLLDAAVKYGGIGAKTQNGFGYISIISGLDPTISSKGRQLVYQDALVQNEKESDDKFNLDHAFSRVYQLTNIGHYLTKLQTIGTNKPEGFETDYIPCAFDIRYKSEQKNPFTGEDRNFGMRPWFKERWGKSATQILFGKSDAKRDEERKAGCIRVSHIYKEYRQQPWQLKVWGYLPKNIESEDRKRKGISAVIKDIDDFIIGPNGMFPDSKVMREYDLKEVLNP